MPYFYHLLLKYDLLFVKNYCKKDHNSAKLYPSNILASFYFQILLKSLVLLILSLGIIDMLHMQYIPSWLEVYMQCFPWFHLQWCIKIHVVTRWSAPDIVLGEGRHSITEEVTGEYLWLVTNPPVTITVAYYIIHKVSSF